MRALFIVNPRATTTTSRARDVIVRAFASHLRLDVAHTEYRFHARKLAREATVDGYELILVLGGDGTVNEVVNGILAAPKEVSRPAVAALPGGSANVFVRALGLPADPVEASGALLEGLRRDTRRSIGLGRVEDGTEPRYFLFCAGFGWDAGVVREVDRQRHRWGATPHRYVAAALRLFLRDPALRRPGLVLRVPGEPAVPDLYSVLVTNTTPWTFAGSLPLRPTPLARFELGLDVFALTRIDTVTTLSLLLRMLAPEGVPPHGRGYITRHDETSFTLHSTTPRAFQVDGEYLGYRTEVNFSAIPKALQIIT